MSVLRCVALLSVLLPAICGCTDYQLKQQLVGVEGVVEVTEFYEYEGTISATLLLENGGLIDIHGIVDEQFTDTSRIDVNRMGNLTIHCEYSGQLGATVSGHNIIAIVSELKLSSDSTAEISNISDLVENYEFVVSLLETLPLRGQAGRVVKFPGRKPYTWECFRVPQARTAAQ